ncbi:hypothetical protein [Shimia sp.]|uniref:hypothetical protein n=1 Tax=Shimia sp. TaxID=1954381 RepID=UPI003BAB891D
MPENSGQIPQATSGPISNDALQSMISTSKALQDNQTLSEAEAHMLMMSMPQLLKELLERRKRMDLIASAVDDTTNVTFLPTANAPRQ